VVEREKRGAFRHRLERLRHDPEILIAIGLVCVVAVIGIARISDYATTIDEWNADDFGRKALAWYTSGFTDRAMFTDVEETLWYYGPWFHMLTTAVQALGFGEHWDVRHAMTFLCGLSGIALLLPMGRLVAGRWAGLAAIVLCLTTGYLYGSLFFTPIDVPFLFAMIAATLSIMLMADSTVPSWRASIGAGLLTGLAIATRSSGAITQAYLVGAMGLCAAEALVTRKNAAGDLARIAVRTVVALVAGWLFAFCLWPWLQIGNPIRQFAEAFRYFANHPASWRMPYWGMTVTTNHLPWHYVPGQLAARLPLEFLLLIVVAMVLGIYGAFSRLDRRALQERKSWASAVARLVTRDCRQVLILGGATFFPVLAVIADGSTLYNGLRHILFVIPLLAVVAAAGFTRLLPTLSRTPIISTAVIGTYIGVQIAVLAALHPLEYIGFNPLVGGVPGAYKRFDMDYWGAAATTALRRLEATTPSVEGTPPSLLICIPWRQSETATMYRRPWRLETDPAKADYIIATEPGPDCAVGQPVVLIDEVKRFGRAFAWTYQRRPGAAVLSAAPYP
jgi:hypothetical protein